MGKKQFNRRAHDPHHISVSLSCRMVFLLVVSTLVVLLLPLACGPYTATHGPATAFRGAIGGWLILFAIASVLRLAVALPTNNLLHAIPTAQQQALRVRIASALLC